MVYNGIGIPLHPISVIGNLVNLPAILEGILKCVLSLEERWLTKSYQLTGRINKRRKRGDFLNWSIDTQSYIYFKYTTGV